MRSRAKRYEIKLRGELKPFFIVADTEWDAEAQAFEIAQIEKRDVKSVRVVITPPRGFERMFYDVFAV
jgi:hypothetical protein